MQEAVQKERKRIALELHDTVCQAHTGAIMHLELAADSLGENLEAREHVHRALQLVRGSMTEMRCALWDLYPEELQKVDLKSAIEYLVKDLTSDNGLNVQFSLRWNEPPAPARDRERFAENQSGSSVEHRETCAGTRSANRIVPRSSTGAPLCEGRWPGIRFRFESRELRYDLDAGTN